MNQYLYRLLLTRVEMVIAGPTPEEQSIVSEHFAHLEALTEQGVMLLVGRTQDNSPRTFGIAIFRAESAERAAEIMNSDPAVRKGIMHAELFPFKISLAGQLAV